MTNPGGATRCIGILGGGITGLAAAYTLARAREAGAPVEEFLIEASHRLGGVIRTERVEGCVVEGGPDSFLTEKPEAASLCRELGLGDSLLGSNDGERRTFIFHRGRLVPLPDGMLLFIPTRLWPIFTTPLLPLQSKLAIVAEYFTPRPSERSGPAGENDAIDESVADFVRRHFGSGMVENVVDPLLAGIFGGDSAELSVRSVLPRLKEMERKYGSLVRGVLAARKQRRKSGGGAVSEAPPLFMTLRDGLERLVEALKTRLDGSRLFLDRRAIAVERSPAGSGGPAAPAARKYEIKCQGGGTFNFDALILALPAYECSRLLSRLDSSVVETLKAIPYTSSLTVTLGFGGGVRDKLPPGFGFLVPRKERKRLLACTFVHNKFHHRAPPDKSLLRCFLGGAHGHEMVALDDDDILSIVRRELGEILNLSEEPLFHRVCRSPFSMPQFQLGHEERVEAIATRLECHPGLFLAGNAYSGVGISDCIRTGRAAAEGALKYCLG